MAVPTSVGMDPAKFRTWPHMDMLPEADKVWQVDSSRFQASDTVRALPHNVTITRAVSEEFDSDTIGHQSCGDPMMSESQLPVSMLNA